MKDNFISIKSNSYLLILILTLTVGALLRFYGLDFGLPELLKFDEPFEINRALRLASGSFDLSRAGKGGFYYIIFFELVISYLVLFFSGIIKSPMDFAHFFVSHESSFYLMARATSAIIAIITIYLIYRIGSDNGGKVAGLLAALFLTISTLNIVNAHYATVDITLTFFLLLTWYFLLSAINKKRLKAFCLTGLFAGLSVITKLPGIIIVVPIILFYLFHRRINFSEGYGYHRSFAFLLIIFCFVVFAGEPGYINTAKNLHKSVKKFYGNKDDLSEENQIGVKQLQFENGKPDISKKRDKLFNFYSKTIIKDVGLPLIIIFIFSIIFFLYRRSYIEILILSFFLMYIFAISATSTVLYHERYVLPLLPLIFLCSGRGIASLIDYFQNKTSLRNNFRVDSVVILLLIILLIPNTLSALEAALKFTKEDIRIEAKKWVQENLAPGTKILMPGSIEQRSQLFIPLVNSKENIKSMIANLKGRDLGKAMYWELRSKYLDSMNAPRYDIIAIKNDVPWMEFDKFKISNIEVVIFDTKAINTGLKARLSSINLSRLKFYQKLNHDKKVSKIKNFGTRIEIFKRTMTDN